MALYRPAIYRFARVRGMQEADAQDLTQSVFAAVANKVGDWEPDAERAKFRTWLARVATNQAITMVRRQRADRAKGGTSIQILLNEQERAEDTVELRQQYRRELFRLAARRVRQEFEETTWQAFWMTSVQGLPVSETAASLARSEGSIYTARSRVIRRMQEMVKHLSQEDHPLFPTTEFETGNSK